VSPSPTPSRLDPRWLIGGGAGLVLLLAVIVILVSRKGGDTPKDDGNRKDGGDQPVLVRQKAKRGGPRADSPEPLTVPRPADRMFKETWVPSPGAIDGVKTWSIESRLATLPYPSRFEFTEDDSLLVHYVPPGGQSWWSRFDPGSCGLKEGRYDGYYAAITPNARTAARVAQGGIQLWEEGGDKEWITLTSPGPFYHASFSPDGKLLVTLDDTGNNTSKELRFWNVKDGSRLATCALTDVTLTPSVHAWSPDSSAFAVSMGRGVALIQAPSEKITRRISRPNLVTALAWSPGGKYLATTESDRHVHIIDDRGETVHDLTDWKTPTADHIPAWAPDGRELAFGTDDNRVIVWDMARKRRSFSLAGHTRTVTAVAFLGDGRTLVSGSRGGLRFWDLKGNSYNGCLLCFAKNEWVAIGPEGDFRASSYQAERRLIIRSRDEKDRLRDFYPEEFTTYHGRQNRPEKVKLTED
jgi:WD40 repeat protein